MVEMNRGWYYLSMKKYLPVATVLLLIIPSVVFASWWNPISWNWSVLFNSPSTLQVQTVSTTTLSSTSTSVIATTSINIVATSTPPASQPVKKVVPKVSPIPAVTSLTPSTSVTPTGLTCPQGYNCAPNVSVQPQTSVVSKNGYQVCIAANATWDGSSFTSSGGYSCTCGAGYTSSPDKKSCIPAPVKTGYQICSEAFPNQTWDGTYGSNGKYNCVCQTGYVGTSDGSCQLRQTQQTVSNECQQVDSQLQQARNAISTYQLHIKQQIADLYSGSMTKDQADQAAQDIQREADAHTAELSMTQSNAVIAYSSCHQLAPSHIYQTNCSSTGDYTSCSTY
jgi:hypothetical protein